MDKLWWVTWQDLFCHHDSGSFSSDVFRTLGCQWEEVQQKRTQGGKGLQKNI